MVEIIETTTTTTTDNKMTTTTKKEAIIKQLSKRCKWKVDGKNILRTTVNYYFTTEMVGDLALASDLPLGHIVKKLKSICQVQGEMGIGYGAVKSDRHYVWINSEGKIESGTLTDFIYELRSHEKYKGDETITFWMDSDEILELAEKEKIVLFDLSDNVYSD